MSNINIEDVKEIIEDVTFYVELTSVAVASLQAIYELLSSEDDMTQIELEELLRANRETIANNRKKAEGFIAQRNNQ